MTDEEAIEYNKNLREYMRITDKDSKYKFLQENYEALDMAIKALEQTELNTSYNSVKTELKPCENMFWRIYNYIIYNYINDKRLAVSPDDITPPEQRAERQVKADLLGEILDVMNDMLEPEMKCGDD